MHKRPELFLKRRKNNKTFFSFFSGESEPFQSETGAIFFREKHTLKTAREREELERTFHHHLGRRRCAAHKTDKTGKKLKIVTLSSIIDTTSETQKKERK